MADSQGASKSSPKPFWGRGTYQSVAHKLATLFAMTAGSANATQFPMMVIAYGGVPFLLAYFAFLGFVTFPAMRLESNLAQFAGDGNRGIFSTVPLFMGIGYTITAYVVFRAVTDTMALSDALALLLSWTRSFDWHHQCPGWWMTRNFSCYAILHGSTPCKLARDELTDSFRHDISTEGLPVASGNQVLLVHSKHYKDEAEGCIPDLPDTGAPYHFRRQAIWEPGAFDLIRAEPLFAIAVIWLLVFAIARRGFLKLKTFFYAIILLHVLTTLMLLLRASTLTGATRGLRLFLQANWASVTNQEMWSNALYVSLESVGVTGTIYLSIERLNCFKNRFQEDVMFVLVADTASKSIGTIVSFLFLGHLSYATGINVHMLVDADFNFIVSILPQAVSMVPFPELWSRIHSLWVVSMMLPKFGGAKGLAVLSNSQNSLRFFLLALEFIVILQLYGAKRLEVDSRLMTGQVPAPFVKFCWTSVIPLTLTLLLAARMLRPLFLDRQYPVFLTALIAWVQLVEISFIPMYAFVFILSTKLSLRDCLVPLPTWVPVSWEQAMLYRQQLAAYGLDAHNFQPPPEAERETVAVPPPSPQEQVGA
ncbi:sodium-dependent proline transporter-like [Dermacentor variabilis]|uniref:sodium-dependent proline transporter-like n=1 Tax=Dermacentor variabilis TaxID=34621 RepID=UPI003F5C926F